MINEAINKLLLGNDLDDITIMEVFDEILSGLADSVVASSFITALKMKNESWEEAANSILASRNAINKINFNYNNENLIENIVLFEDKNTLDISLATDIICAANNLGALKYSFNSPFYKNNSFEVLSKLNINFNNEKFKDEFEILNFAYMLLEPEEAYYKYSSQISRKLPFFNIFNTIDKMLNPYGAKNQMIGVNGYDFVEKFANISLKLNNSNTIVVSGANNLPYISCEGETKVAEAWKNKIFTYNLTPELLGFKTYSIDEIKCENAEHNAQILFDVFSTKLKGAPYEMIIMNSALALYISKKADSILEGLELAKKTIDDGLALHKLKQIQNAFKVNIN